MNSSTARSRCSRASARRRTRRSCSPHARRARPSANGLPVGDGVLDRAGEVGVGRGLVLGHEAARPLVLVHAAARPAGWPSPTSRSRTAAPSLAAAGLGERLDPLRLPAHEARARAAARRRSRRYSASASSRRPSLSARYARLIGPSMRRSRASTRGEQRGRLLAARPVADDGGGEPELARRRASPRAGVPSALGERHRLHAGGERGGERASVVGHRLRRQHVDERAGSRRGLGGRPRASVEQLVGLGRAAQVAERRRDAADEEVGVLGGPVGPADLLVPVEERLASRVAADDERRRHGRRRLVGRGRRRRWSRRATRLSTVARMSASAPSSIERSSVSMSRSAASPTSESTTSPAAARSWAAASVMPPDRRREAAAQAQAVDPLQLVGGCRRRRRPRRARAARRPPRVRPASSAAPAAQAQPAGAVGDVR